MYTIVNVVYGSPVPSNLEDKAQGKAGVTTLYHGGEPTHGVSFVGVVIDEWDECRDIVKASSIRLTPTPAERAQAQGEWSAAPRWLTDVLPPVGTYYVHSTS